MIPCLQRHIDSRIGEVLLLKWKPEIKVDKDTVVVTTHNGEVGGTHSVQFSVVDCISTYNVALVAVVNFFDSLIFYIILFTTNAISVVPKEWWCSAVLLYIKVSFC